MDLPNLITLQECENNPTLYLEEVYRIFKHDLVDNPPHYRGKGIRLKRYPEVEGKEYTFYHMTHSGDIETERIPDLRRMERIRWPRPIILDSRDDDLKVWGQIRRGKGGTKKRICILHETERYIVILDDRDQYILFWTAFNVRKHNIERYLKEYKEYISRNR